MKDNLRKLNLMVALGIVQMDWFYSVTLYPYEIVFQGKFDSDIVKKLKSLFQFAVDNDFVIASSRGIRIVLT